MKKLITPGAILFFLLGIIFSACEKKEIQGPKGEPGSPGGGGNSNISSSDVFVITSSQWKENADFSAWETKFDSPMITKEVVEKGVVKVLLLNGNSWSELPFTIGDRFVMFGFTVGSVRLTFTDVHGGLPTVPGTSSYRLVTFSESAKSTPLILDGKEIPSENLKGN